MQGIFFLSGVLQVEDRRPLLAALAAGVRTRRDAVTQTPFANGSRHSYGWKLKEKEEVRKGNAGQKSRPILEC